MILKEGDTASEREPSLLTIHHTLKKDPFLPKKKKKKPDAFHLLEKETPLSKQDGLVGTDDLWGCIHVWITSHDLMDNKKG